MDSSFLMTVCFQVSITTQPPTTKLPGTMKLAERSNRLPRSLLRLRKQLQNQVQRLRNRLLQRLKAAAGNIRKRVAKVAVTRLRADQVRRARLDKNRRRGCRRMWPTIFHYSTRAVCFTF